MTGEARIEYAVGIRWPEGTDTEAYDCILALPDYEPEKHELFAHMLLLAVRKEWAEAERLKRLRADQEARARRRAAKKNLPKKPPEVLAATPDPGSVGDIRKRTNDQEGSAMQYDASTPINEPVEIRLTDPFGNPKTLAAWVNDHGMIASSYGGSGGGVAESLSNMQPKQAFPRKAVAGWQAEVVAFANGSLYKVTEIR